VPEIARLPYGYERIRISPDQGPLSGALGIVYPNRHCDLDLIIILNPERAYEVEYLPVKYVGFSKEYKVLCEDTDMVAEILRNEGHLKGVI